MIVPLTRRVRLRIAVPLWLQVDGDPQLEMNLDPLPPDVNVPPPPMGYRLRVLDAGGEPSLRSLLNAAGFPLSTDQLRLSLATCLPAGCFIVEHEATGQPVAAMMARHFATESHPFGGRIDWLATDPEHRGRGLANICARSATRRLLQARYEHIWVTTDDHRLAALKIFFGIGFRPTISPSTQARWRNVGTRLGTSLDIA